MNRLPAFLLGLALLLLAGCAGVSTAPAPTTPAPATPSQSQAPSTPDTPDGSAQARPLPGGEAETAGDLPGAVVEPPPMPPVSGNRAVVALLDRAQRDAGTGRPDAAGATLERALRIEPRNARLWHELAQLRLAQGQYAQAIALAQKSNSFAATQRRLQALNWRVIAQSRIAQGQTEEGRKALALATQLERQTGVGPE